MDVVPALGLSRETTAASVFVLTYLVVALGRVPWLRLDRTGAAVVGAAFMVALHVVTPELSRADAILPAEGAWD